MNNHRDDPEIKALLLAAGEELGVIEVREEGTENIM
jgi:hypothetical protein